MTTSPPSTQLGDSPTRRREGDLPQILSPDPISDKPVPVLWRPGETPRPSVTSGRQLQLGAGEQIAPVGPPTTASPSKTSARRISLESLSSDDEGHLTLTDIFCQPPSHATEQHQGVSTPHASGVPLNLSEQSQSLSESHSQRFLPRRMRDTVALGRRETTWLRSALREVAILDESDSSSASDALLASREHHEKMRKKKQIHHAPQRRSNSFSSDSDDGKIASSAQVPKLRNRPAKKKEGFRNSSTRELEAKTNVPGKSQAVQHKVVNKPGSRLGVGVHVENRHVGWASGVDATAENGRRARGFRWSNTDVSSIHNSVQPDITSSTARSFISTGTMQDVGGDEPFHTDAQVRFISSANEGAYDDSSTIANATHTAEAQRQRDVVLNHPEWAQTNDETPTTQSIPSAEPAVHTIPSADPVVLTGRSGIGAVEIDQEPPGFGNFPSTRSWLEAEQTIPTDGSLCVFDETALQTWEDENEEEVREVLDELGELGQARARVQTLETQLLNSSIQLEEAAEEMNRLVEHNEELERQQLDTATDLETARSHARRQELSLKVLEKDVAGAMHSKSSADEVLQKAQADREELRLETQRLKLQLRRNEEALAEAETHSMMDAEAAEALMQETAARLDKVQAAWIDAQDKVSALAGHSSQLTSQLNEKTHSLAVAQASQELALSRVRVLEAERRHLKQVIKSAEDHYGDAKSMHESAAKRCSVLESKVNELEAQLRRKDQLLQSMQAQLYDTASSHRNIAADLEQLLSPPPPLPPLRSVARSWDLEVVTCQALFTPDTRAIEARDSPIKGIIFSRYGDNTSPRLARKAHSPRQNQDSPRKLIFSDAKELVDRVGKRDNSPRLAQSAVQQILENVDTAAAVTVELGFLEGLEKGGAARLSSAGALASRQMAETWDMTISSMAHGSNALATCAETIHNGRRLTPRIVAHSPRRMPSTQRSYEDEKLPPRTPRTPRTPRERELDSLSSLSEDTDPTAPISDESRFDDNVLSARDVVGVVTNMQSAMRRMLTQRKYGHLLKSLRRGPAAQHADKLDDLSLSVLHALEKKKNLQMGSGIHVLSDERRSALHNTGCLDGKRTTGESGMVGMRQEHRVVRAVLDEQEKFLKSEIARHNKQIPAVAAVFAANTHLQQHQQQGRNQEDVTGSDILIQAKRREMLWGGKALSSLSAKALQYIEPEQQALLASLEKLEAETDASLATLAKFDKRDTDSHAAASIQSSMLPAEPAPAYHEDSSSQNARLEQLAGRLRMLDTPPPPVKETVPGAEREAANVIEMDPLVILERQLEALDRPHQRIKQELQAAEEQRREALIKQRKQDTEKLSHLRAKGFSGVSTEAYAAMQNPNLPCNEPSDANRARLKAETQGSAEAQNKEEVINTTRTQHVHDACPGFPSGKAGKMRMLSSNELQEALAEPVAAVAAPVAHATAPEDHVWPQAISAAESSLGGQTFFTAQSSAGASKDVFDAELEFWFQVKLAQELVGGEGGERAEGERSNRLNRD